MCKLCTLGLKKNPCTSHLPQNFVEFNEENPLGEGTSSPYTQPVLQPPPGNSCEELHPCMGTGPGAPCQGLCWASMEQGKVLPFEGKADKILLSEKRQPNYRH